MSRSLLLILYVLAMVVVIVGLDVTLFRDRFTARLIVNIVIVALFGAGYFLLFRRP